MPNIISDFISGNASLEEKILYLKKDFIKNNIENKAFGFVELAGDGLRYRNEGFGINTMIGFQFIIKNPKSLFLNLKKI